MLRLTIERAFKDIWNIKNDKSLIYWHVQWWRSNCRCIVLTFCKKIFYFFFSSQLKHFNFNHFEWNFVTQLINTKKDSLCKTLARAFCEPKIFFFLKIICATFEKDNKLHNQFKKQQEKILKKERISKTARGKRRGEKNYIDR